ncbi:MAG: hypothetical protein KJ955_00145 [Nanoarchaeota archaeon]|nr:hypothetical protein [Nanoarchaeota archaeon]
MLIVDDLLLGAVKETLKPFDIVWLLGLIRDYALKEKYNLEKINNEIKENRLLFEIGDVSEEEYKEKHGALLEKRETTKKIIENLSKDMNIQAL